MIAELLAPCAVAAEILGDVAVAPLLPDEEAALGKVAPARRRDFALGRACARRALRRLGGPQVAILPGVHREPLWPRGVVGSITHCRGYAAAAVAPQEELASLGIDAEPHDTLPHGVLPLVAVDGEIAWLRERRADEICWDRVLFSAKESVYKAWFPLTHEWLGFHDALVIFDGGGTFRATLLVDPPQVDGRPLRTLSGRYAVADGLVATAVAVPRCYE